MSFQREDEGKADLHLKLYLEGRGQAQGQGGVRSLDKGHGQEPVFEGLNISWTPCPLKGIQETRAAAAPPSEDVTYDNCHPHLNMKDCCLPGRRKC